MLALALGALQAGRSPLIYSAAGPDDPAVTTFAAQAEAAGLGVAEASARVGDALAAQLQHRGAHCTVLRAGDALDAVAQEIRLMLDEGVVAEPQDIDLCMLLGAGWPFQDAASQPGQARLS